MQQSRVLEQALSTNPKTQNALQKLIRKVIMEARKSVTDAASRKMENDPRGAAQAVRTSVYKKILGANINIFSSRKAHERNSYEPPRKGVSGRGGNRRSRSDRTQQIMGYAPLDRGFILRWLNEGVSERKIRFKADERRSNGQWPSVAKWTENPNTGRRGSIAARNFFRGTGEQALAQAVENLAMLIETELEAMLNKK